MKNIALSLILVCGMVFSAMAESLKVVTTIPDLADFARQVGGNKVEVYSMANGVEDPHNVQMKPSMISKLAAADVYIQMGLDMEHTYAPAMLEASRNQRIQEGKPGFLDTSKGVRVREIPKSLDRVEGDVHPAGNPHYNLNPAYAKMMVSAIAEHLSDLQPENRAYFEANAKRYLAELDAKIRDWKSKISGRRVKFVSYHSHLVYFEEFFAVELMGTIEPKPGVEPGPRHIEDLINLMKKNRVKLIIKESFFSDRIPHEIAVKTGALVRSVPVMVGATPEATTYIKMMDQVVDAFASRT